MLVLGVILLILGGLVAYLGRPREPWLLYAGVIIFVIGAALVLIWALSAADANTDVDAALFGPLAYLLRRIARKLDGQQEVIIPPGGYVFWAVAPRMPSAQWLPPSTNTAPSTDSKFDLN